MRHLHVMSVGISLKSNLANTPAKCFPKAANLGRDRDYKSELCNLFAFPAADPVPREDVSTALSAVTDPAVDGGAARARLLEKLKNQQENLDRPLWQQWTAGASAELTSLAAHYEQKRDFAVRLEARDSAVLIASDTSAGLRCALFTALVLAGAQDGDTDSALDRIAYFPEPSDDLLDYSRAKGAVSIVRIPGLDARNRDASIRAMRRFGVLGRRIDAALHQDKDLHTALYLSGGYRAAGPYLIGIGEYLRGRYRKPIRVSAGLIHDESDRLELAPVHLRSLPLEFLLSQIGEAAAEVRKAGRLPHEDSLTGDVVIRKKPYQEALLGYAYERSPNGAEWPLTPYGYALCEMMRDRVES